MHMDGKILQIQRERDKPYIYMPNPATLHSRSIKIDHHLKIVDFYIHSGMPEVFIPEPNFKNYKPDVYMKDKQGIPICVEIQLTPISTKRMQAKIDEFVSTYKKEHDAQVMLLVSNNEYGKITFPSSFKLVRIPIPDEPYAQKRA
jgi:hypothetical protein